MPLTGTRRRVWLAALIGFCVPILWGIVGFVFFSAQQSAWTNAFWIVVYLTCPTWVFPNFGMVLVPLSNALLYVVLAALLGRIRRAHSPPRAPS